MRKPLVPSETMQIPYASTSFSKSTSTPSLAPSSKEDSLIVNKLHDRSEVETVALENLFYVLSMRDQNAAAAFHLWYHDYSSLGWLSSSFGTTKS